MQPRQAGRQSPVKFGIWRGEQEVDEKQKNGGKKLQWELARSERNPTAPSTILELRDQEFGEICVVHERRTMDFGGPKFWKGSDGKGEREKGDMGRICHPWREMRSGRICCRFFLLFICLSGWKEKKRSQMALATVVQFALTALTKRCCSRVGKFRSSN